MDKLPPSCAFGLPSYCAFRVSFPPPHFSSCNSLSDLQRDCHDGDHPKSHLIRGRIKWPQHQGVFPISILFGLRPLTFSSSIWLLYSGTPVNMAWAQDGDLNSVLTNFTHGLGKSPKPSGNPSQLFMFLPSSPHLGLSKGYSWEEFPNSFYSSHLSVWIGILSLFQTHF